MQDLLINTRGYFWWGEEPIPDGHFAPQDAVVGTLEVSEVGRTELTLDGALQRDQPGGLWRAALSGELLEGRSIRGILADTNQHVILTDLSSLGMKVSSRGPSKERKALSGAFYRAK